MNVWTLLREYLYSRHDTADYRHSPCTSNDVHLYRDYPPLISLTHGSRRKSIASSPEICSRIFLPDCYIDSTYTRPYIPLRTLIYWSLSSWSLIFFCSYMQKIYSNKHISWKRILNILVIAIISYILWTGWQIYSFSYVNETRPSDTAIVFGAAIWWDVPSPVFAARIDHALWLYENRIVKKIIFTWWFWEWKLSSESEVARKYAIEHGIPEKDIFIEDSSTKTRENLSFIAWIIQKEHMTSALLVSDPYHMKRALLMSRVLWIPTYSSPTHSSQYQSWKNKTLFLMREVYYLIWYELGTFL